MQVLINALRPFIRKDLNPWPSKPFAPVAMGVGLLLIASAWYFTPKPQEVASKPLVASKHLVASKPQVSTEPQVTPRPQVSTEPQVTPKPQVRAEASRASDLLKCTCIPELSTTLHALLSVPA